MNGSTTLRLDAGPIALAGRGHSIIQLFGQTRRTSPADGTHGDPNESQHNQASAGAGEQLVGKLVKVNQLTSTNQSNQAENQYSDGVTPPPTDKSGRGGKELYKETCVTEPEWFRKDHNNGLLRFRELSSRPWPLVSLELFELSDSRSSYPLEGPDLLPKFSIWYLILPDLTASRTPVYWQAGLWYLSVSRPYYPPGFNLWYLSASRTGHPLGITGYLKIPASYRRVPHLWQAPSSSRCRLLKPFPKIFHSSDYRFKNPARVVVADKSKYLFPWSVPKMWCWLVDSPVFVIFYWSLWCLEGNPYFTP
ncbi:hypothetical protein J6590_062668 [Homalodisca vitripennis]|nr:hypothetical protein J6590_062668 [Homalodisca vitripennis]